MDGHTFPDRHYTFEPFPEIERVLVDAQNFHDLAGEIGHAIRGAPLIGLDIETEDSGRHAGLEAMLSKKLVFDVKRTTVCGLSIWPENHPRAYYFNLAHADVENRLAWDAVKILLDLKQDAAKWVIHNAVFERTMLGESLGWEIQNYICTMQMAVSAYGPDEYDWNVFLDRGIGDMGKLLPEIVRVSRQMTETVEMQECLAKIIAKESEAAHSWNGYVGQMSYGYGLKKAVKSFFGYDMVTFEQVMNGRDHMGQLTGPQVFHYGCDDAIWCLRLYRRLVQFMLDNNPQVLPTYFEQELPMVEVYSEVWREGVRIDAKAVAQREVENRARYAAVLRKLRAEMRKLLPFTPGLHHYMEQHESWYAKNGPRYRKMIVDWCALSDHHDDFQEAYRVRGPISNGWAAVRGVPENKNALNLAYYMVTRTIIYDLFQIEEPIVDQGKVQSDAWARGRLKERMVKAGRVVEAEVLGLLGEIATIEQAQKLYLAPYQKLVDPDTEKLHPQLTSELATRRTAMKDPNAQQLAKRGETVYVRGFYKADYDDHVIVSLDWSQIELVLAGEYSQDEVFVECFSTLPFKDLHEIGAAACLDVEVDEFRRLKKGDPNVSSHLLVNPKGEKMEPDKAYKFWRTELGKGSSFENLYSPNLRNVGEKLGWSNEKTNEITELYHARFAGYEQWKLETQAQMAMQGFVELPCDHHRRVRYEALPAWVQAFKAKWARFDSAEVNWFIDKAANRISRRAARQGVNFLIQSACATLMKRSILRARKRMAEIGWTKRDARFMFAVHDELVFSVHRSRVRDFILLARETMLTNHEDIIRTLKIDCSPSVGLTFEPWHKEKARLGQIELYEAPEIDVVPKELIGGRLPEGHWDAVVDWLFAERARG